MASLQQNEHAPAPSFFTQPFAPAGPLGSAFQEASYDGYGYFPEQHMDRAGSVGVGDGGYGLAGHSDVGYDGRSAFALAKQFSGFSVGPGPQYQDSQQWRYGPNSRSMNIDHGQGSPTRRRMSGPLPNQYGAPPGPPSRGRGGYGGRGPGFHTVRLCRSMVASVG